MILDGSKRSFIGFVVGQVKFLPSYYLRLNLYVHLKCKRDSFIHIYIFFMTWVWHKEEFLKIRTLTVQKVG